LFIGILYGPLVLQTAPQYVPPLGWGADADAILRHSVVIALLLAPVMAGLLARRTYLSVSVADAFGRATVRDQFAVSSPPVRQ
jgi:hypothetical protein